MRLETPRTPKHVWFHGSQAPISPNKRQRSPKEALKKSLGKPRATNQPLLVKGRRETRRMISHRPSRLHLICILMFSPFDLRMTSAAGIERGRSGLGRRYRKNKEPR
ncbi:hypothetical protein E2C01_090966 [Portunus trituberculatus]|uniref:Uncharacterized protein n=1 Tax=Portunus trituberculatus TaxID=210409 RepID=A0A5B7JCR6_PORTR|nr:hypothetical protein [Portunus trituberculatus]